jgi:hypothetical protein
MKRTQYPPGSEKGKSAKSVTVPHILRGYLGRMHIPGPTDFMFLPSVLIHWLGPCVSHVPPQLSSVHSFTFPGVPSLGLQGPGGSNVQTGLPATTAESERKTKYSQNIADVLLVERWRNMVLLMYGVEQALGASCKAVDSVGLPKS